MAEQLWLEETLLPKLVNDGIFIYNNKQLKGINVLPLDEGGTFMATICFKGKIIFINDKQDEVEISLVIKVTPNVSEEMYKNVQYDKLFENEIYAYKEIIPTLGQLNCYPKYYYGFCEPIKACIVLSDFGVAGWKMSPTLKNLSIDHINLALKQLGNFHGHCYVLKEKNRIKFNDIIKNFKESRFSNQDTPPVYNELLKAGTIRAITAAKECSEFKDKIPDDYLEKMKCVLEEPLKYARSSVIPREPLAIICHGDYLRNNIAFKYNNDQIPIDCMMFDFQTLRYSSPMIDLTTFMTNSTSYDERRDNFKIIFNIYHQELIKTLCDGLMKTPEELPDYYSYDEFLKEYARLLPYGLSIASSFLALIHEPDTELMSNFLNDDKPMSVIIEESFKRGGQDVDKELAAIIYEIYTMQNEYKIDLI